MLQRLLETTSLTGGQWLTVIGLSAIAPAVVALDRWMGRRHATPSSERRVGGAARA
jgi:Ca2+-transporting ATPase